jgi:hypothetical protein
MDASETAPPLAMLNLSAALKSFAADRQQRKLALDSRVHAALTQAAEIEQNITACCGKELMHAAANQRHLDIAVRALQQSVSSLSRQFSTHSAQYEVLIQSMKDVGSIPEWLRIVDDGLKSTLSLISVIEHRLSQTD